MPSSRPRRTAIVSPPPSAAPDTERTPKNWPEGIIYISKNVEHDQLDKSKGHAPDPRIGEWLEIRRLPPQHVAYDERMYEILDIRNA